MQTVIKSLLAILLVWLPVVAVSVVADVLAEVDAQRVPQASQTASAAPAAAAVPSPGRTTEPEPAPRPTLAPAAESPASPIPVQTQADSEAASVNGCTAASFSPADPGLSRLSAGAPARIESVAVAGDGAITGTSPDDLALFARSFNDIRTNNCLAPLPVSNFRYDSCLEERLIWMAEDPSTDPASAWGHIGSVRSDGLPSVGCDGTLAGGDGTTAGSAALKWWDSMANRQVLYRPDSPELTDECIGFAIVHGGLPDEPASFTRAAAARTGC